MWSALLVFQILLIRDRKAHVNKQIEEVWEKSKYWFLGGALQFLKNKNIPLDHMDLSDNSLSVFETNMDAFKKVLRAAKKHQVAAKHSVAASLESQTRTVSHDEYQKIIDELATQLDSLEGTIGRFHGRIAFLIGMAAIVANMIFLRFHVSTEAFANGVLALNLLGAVGFAWQVFHLLD